MGNFWKTLAYALLGSGPTAKNVKEAQMLAYLQEQNETLKNLEKEIRDKEKR